MRQRDKQAPHEEDYPGRNGEEHAISKAHGWRRAEVPPTSAEPIPRRIERHTTNGKTGLFCA